MYLQDKCAVVEYFGSLWQSSPSQSIILATFPHHSGAKLGITGVLTLSMSKSAGTHSVFGLLQLGSGAEFSTMPS